jgi:hypothetical protein
MIFDATLVPWQYLDDRADVLMAVHRGIDDLLLGLGTRVECRLPFVGVLVRAADARHVHLEHQGSGLELRPGQALNLHLPRPRHDGRLDVSGLPCHLWLRDVVGHRLGDLQLVAGRRWHKRCLPSLCLMKSFPNSRTGAPSPASSCEGSR